MDIVRWQFDWGRSPPKSNEASGSLRMVGNHSRVQRQREPDARDTTRAGTKVGLSDPVVQSEGHRSRIKALGDKKAYHPHESTSTGGLHLDVGSSHPG